MNHYKRRGKREKKGKKKPKPYLYLKNRNISTRDWFSVEADLEYNSIVLVKIKCVPFIGVLSATQTVKKTQTLRFLDCITRNPEPNIGNENVLEGKCMIADQRPAPDRGSRKEKEED